MLTGSPKKKKHTQRAGGDPIRVGWSLCQASAYDREFTAAVQRIALSERDLATGKDSKQGCGIKGFIPASVIQANLPLYMGD